MVNVRVMLVSTKSSVEIMTLPLCYGVISMSIWGQISFVHRKNTR